MRRRSLAIIALNKRKRRFYSSEKLTQRTDYSETNARIDLAAVHRLACLNKWEEGICNHLTYALDTEHFLVMPFGLHFSDVRASDFIIVNAKTSKVVDKGSGRGTDEPSATAFYLHSRLHIGLGEQGRCLLHTHAPYSTALTMVKGGRLEMVHQNSLRFQNTICYDNSYQGLVLDETEGDRLSKIIKGKKIMMMGNHGVMVADKSISLAYNSHYYLERACMHQVLAMSTGLPLQIISDKVCQAAATYFPGKEEEFYADCHFNAMKLMLDKTQPEYKD